jgi:hypothetical protein
MDPNKFARSVQYNCVKITGNGSASEYLTPLFQAWAASERILLASGTLNLCAHRDVVLPDEFVALKPWDSALKLDWRKSQPGYDPRLYFAAINRTEPAWLFRWSDNAYLEEFVGDTSECLAPRLFEVVAEANLSDKLGLRPGDSVTLHFK